MSVWAGLVLLQPTTGRTASRGRGGHAFDGCLGAGQDVDADREDHGCEQQWAELEIRSAAIILRYITLQYTTPCEGSLGRAAQGHIIRRVSTIFSSAWWAVRAGERASIDGLVPYPGSRLEGRGGMVQCCTEGRSHMDRQLHSLPRQRQRREEGRGAFCESFLHSTVLPCWG